jgi:hypothetical protein
MKVYQETIRQTVGNFVGELPEKLNNKPTVKAHTDSTEPRWNPDRSHDAQLFPSRQGALTKLPAIDKPHPIKEETP